MTDKDQQLVDEGKILNIRPRYYRLYTDPGVELAEDNYRYAALNWQMPVGEAALVAVDVWNLHYSRDTLERVDEITRNKIVPVVEACRANGLQIIHAPADPVASRHPNVMPEIDNDPRCWPSLRRTEQSPDWPPPEFRKKEGRYSQYARPHEPQEADIDRQRYELRDFHPAVRPEGNEPVIRNGEELHRFCAERGIVHLFYVGFNTNACIILRNYGVVTMSLRGYNVVLLRDCTTGMETHETKAAMTCTQGTIVTLEQFLAYTMTSDELVTAME